MKRILEIITDNPISESLNALRKQAFTTHDFNDVYQLLSTLQDPFNPRHTKFLKPSDYKINRSEQYHLSQPQESYVWGLPQQNAESCVSDAEWNNALWQGISLDTENNPGAKELF